MLMNLGCFRGDEKIDLRLQKRKRLDKSTNAKYVLFVPIILHLNVEGLSTNNICVISQLATTQKVPVIFLHEIHCTNAYQLVIPHFALAGWVSSRKHELATFVHEKLSWTLADQSEERSAIQWLCVDIDRCKIVNVYKPPTSHFSLTVIPMFSYLCLYAGDFNCKHTD